jgi:dephospho-CoA kinase
MLLVGLTGNYGMGKSTVLRMFQRLGAVTYDADEIVSSLLLEETVRRRIRDLLGNDIFLDDGSLDKKKVASLVFADDALRRALEDILHPLVFRRIKSYLEREGGRSGIVIIEAPLLFERGYEDRFRRIISIRTERDRTLKRLEAKGIPREDALPRISSQLPITEKIRKSDFIIHNDGTFEETEKQVREIYDKLLHEDNDGNCRRS